MRATTAIFVLMLALVAVTNAAEAQTAADHAILSNAEIVEMVKLGLSERVVVAKIRACGCQLDTSTAALSNLKASGVPDSIVVTMIEVSSGAKGETANTAPAVPALPIFASSLQESACVTPVASAGTRTWKYGEPEEREFARISGISDPAARLELFNSFLSRYPSSDYRGPVLYLKVSAAYRLKKWDEGLTAAEQLLRSPDLIAPVAFLGYVTEADLLPLFIKSGDPLNQGRIEELANSVRCGREVLAGVSCGPTPEPHCLQYMIEAKVAFARAQAQVAGDRKDYATARRELQQARQLNPQDTRANLLQSWAEFSDEAPDSDAGIFYLARASILAPDVVALQDSLTEAYTLLHGSAEGLDTVKGLAAANHDPPTGFHIVITTQPPVGEVAGTNRHPGRTILAILRIASETYQQCLQDQSCGTQQSRVPAGRSAKPKPKSALK